MTPPSQPSSGILATTPLYYQTSSLRFSAEVVAVNEQKVALDQTAFYPEGGGQNADIGWLTWLGESVEHEVTVLTTQKDKATGVIWHTVEGRPPGVGQQVTGLVAAQNRWHGQQRHSAEPLLAAAFYHLNPAFGVAAVSMRSAECTINTDYVCFVYKSEQHRFAHSTPVTRFVPTPSSRVNS